MNSSAICECAAHLFVPRVQRGNIHLQATDTTRLAASHSLLQVSRKVARSAAVEEVVEVVEVVELKAVAGAAAEMASETERAGAIVMAAAAKRTVPMQSVPRPSVDSVVKAEQLARAREVASSMQLPALIAVRGYMKDSIQHRTSGMSFDVVDIASCHRHPMQALQLNAALHGWQRRFHCHIRYHRPSTQSSSKRTFWTVSLEAYQRRHLFFERALGWGCMMGAPSQHQNRPHWQAHSPEAV